MSDALISTAEQPPSTPPTTWNFYLSTGETWNEMLAAIKNATSTIDVEQFILEADNIGRQFVTTLIERAQAGVKVRLLVDSMGSFSLGQSLFVDALADAGVEVRFFNWITPFSNGNKRTWYFRDHRRALIIDGTRAFTGGVCIADRTRDWRDTTLNITGEILQQIRYAFEGTWKKAHQRSIRVSKRSRPNLDGFVFLTLAPLPRQRYLYYALIDAIRHAERTIYITTPYFLPDHRMMRVLILARKRGVDVRVLIPRISDHPIVDRGSHTYFHHLLKHGIRLFRYHNMIHAKTVSVDGNWGMVGSMNMDNVSLRYNFESAVVATNSAFARELEGHFTADLRSADELSLKEWNQRSFISKVLERIVWPIRKLL